MTPKTARKWIESFDLTDARDKATTTADEVDLLDLITSSTITYQGMPFMISQLIQHAVGNQCTTSKQLLAAYGIRADRMADSVTLSIFLDPKNPQLRELLSRVGKGNYDLVAMLTRIPGWSKDRQRIGSYNPNGIRVPTSITLPLPTCS